MKITVICSSLLFLAGIALAADNTDVEGRRKQLNDLLAEQWEYTLRTSPEFASILGDKRYNDKLSDVSEKAVLADLEQAKKFLTRFESINTEGFPEQEALNKALMVRGLKQQIDNSRFQNYMMPVTQFYGIHIDAPQLVPLLAFDTVKDYDDYITRLKGVGKQFEDTIDVMRKGLAHKLMPPKILLEKAVRQTEDIADDKPDASPFAQPLQKLPKSFSPKDQQRIREQMLAAIERQVLPAYQRFAKFLNEEYVPKGRSEPGLWSLPDGDARYAARVKDSTTTTMTPEEIHQLGLREVARIEGEMLQVAKKLGFSDLKSFYAALPKNADLHPKSRQQMLDLYRKYTDQMYAKIPQLFGRLPKAKVEIKPVEEFREKEASGAQYNQGAPDGSRPGYVMVNTGDFQNRDTVTIETTAYHEGVPGHHMQISIAQELPALPPFRQQSFYTAFVEGWALYSERLGREVGFFQDPYSFYGHLQDEMLRAIRLVADTGFHYKRWTRQQVVDFFHQHSGIPEVEVQSETDRYIAIPGQALGYKIGQLKFLELRAKAQKRLGDKFDVRAFHDEVLGAGALPLDVLEERVDRWITEQASAKATD
jgi:uncharacterized protein (DUF885 family)